MKGRTQFWLGSVMLALAVGLLVSSLVFAPATYGQEEGRGEGRTGRYAIVIGIRGASPNTQTLYVVDDVHEIIFAFEYYSRSHKFEFRSAADIQRYAGELIELRAKRERGQRNR